LNQEGEQEGDGANEELEKGIWRRGTWICQQCWRSTRRSGGGGGLTAATALPGGLPLLSLGVRGGS